MEAVAKISEHGRWVEPPSVGDQFIHYDSGNLQTVIKVGGTYVILRDEEDGQEVEESFVDEYDGLFSDAYEPVVNEEAVSKISESPGPRDATISVIQLMDEGILSPRQVADAALSYLSEAEVADLAVREEWFGDEDFDDDTVEDEDFYGISRDDDFEESVEVVGEEVGNDYNESIRKSMLEDMQQLEEDTLRVYQEASSEESKSRPDYTQMLLNELRETLTQITDIVNKYD